MLGSLMIAHLLVMGTKGWHSDCLLAFVCFSVSMPRPSRRSARFLRTGMAGVAVYALATSRIAFAAMAVGQGKRELASGGCRTSVAVRGERPTMARSPVGTHSLTSGRGGVEAGIRLITMPLQQLTDGSTTTCHHRLSRGFLRPVDRIGPSFISATNERSRPARSLG